MKTGSPSAINGAENSGDKVDMSSVESQFIIDPVM